VNKQNARKAHQAGRQVLHRVELQKMLDILSACDRGVVEFSMGLYNVPRRDRVLMRQQNRRLHRALRKCLPQLLRPPQSLFQLSDPR
jgi:hypothetical protein